LGALVKRPGEAMVGRPVELAVGGWVRNAMGRYERLLGDAMRGDAMLVAREDWVEAAWRVVDPVLAAPTPLHEYEAGTWGPPEADALVAGGGGWHRPAELA
jgi:glucose-6-phosphate 1-dehydrogenase